jgi:sugar phosphate isomerase/epimerase
MNHSTRRTFLATAAAVAAARAASGATSEEHHWSDVRLGVATYSLRQFSRADAIQIIKSLGVKYVNVKSMHMPYDATPQELAAARAEFEAAGLQIIGGGNVSLRGDENEVKKMLTYAKNAGFPIVICAPRTDNLDIVEKYAMQFDLKIAIHNHGPKDNFPNGTAVLKAVKNMDPRMGLCYDIGHAAQTGVNVVEEIKAAGPRIYDVHMKDMTSLDDNENWVDVGEGKIPVPEIFLTLKKMRYPGTVDLEYEINPKAPQQGMAKSFAYMRGVLDGQAS